MRFHFRPDEPFFEHAKKNLVSSLINEQGLFISLIIFFQLQTFGLTTTETWTNTVTKKKVTQIRIKCIHLNDKCHAHPSCTFVYIHTPDPIRISFRTEIAAVQQQWQDNLRSSFALWPPFCGIPRATFGHIASTAVNLKRKTSSRIACIQRSFNGIKIFSITRRMIAWSADGVRSSHGFADGRPAQGRRETDNATDPSKCTNKRISDLRPTPLPSQRVQPAVSRLRLLRHHLGLKRGRLRLAVQYPRGGRLPRSWNFKGVM